MYKVFELTETGLLKKIEMPDYEETIGGFYSVENAEEAIELDSGQFLKYGKEYLVIKTKEKLR